jgi:hypothetical protein
MGSTLEAVAVASIVGIGVAILLHQEYGVTFTRDGIKGPERQAPRVHAADVGGPHAFMQVDQGRPVTYNPCKPVRIVVNDAIAPVGADALLAEAIAQVSAASGLRLDVVGKTDEASAQDRLSRQPGRYGSGWAPVLVAWTTPEQEPRLRGDRAGIGGSVAERTGLTSRPRYVTGIVALHAPTLRQMLTRPDGWDLARALIMHELAHVVGLDHVDDPHQLMYDDNLGLVGFGPGDLEGLAALGAGSCL